ncbi:MAG: phasin family protein [Candidatus Afipia apatlaquensis]|uniref:Phasin family protein n=1 Tax=Candidatus Afipia apatlaquensis TaxID=2712852 RepID=A0A7C9VQH7_9BRAD|nr:phasin family protein [Candidatus Afipia apatlaquensis]
MEADSKQSANPGAIAMPWLDDLKKLVERFQLPGIDVAALVEWQRKDMEALAEANRQASEGIKALVERRNEILQETLAQWQSAVKDATGIDGMSKQAEAVRQGVEKAVANLRQLSQMEAQTRNNAWKVVQDRMQENMASLQKLLQPR